MFQIIIAHEKGKHSLGPLNTGLDPGLQLR